jgi:hypothetical protein
VANTDQQPNDRTNNHDRMDQITVFTVLLLTLALTVFAVLLLILALTVFTVLLLILALTGSRTYY